MPDNLPSQEVLNIVIKKTKSDRECFAANLFVAFVGSKVTFTFNEPNARITFVGDSPFDEVSFPPGLPMSVRVDAPAKHYNYIVTWPQGHGNGGGVVLGSRA